jgi:hypothetical protein
MQGIDAAYKTLSTLEAPTEKMSSTLMLLLNAGIGDDDAGVTHLTNTVRVAAYGLSSAQVVSVLRQYGTYKQPSLIDGVVNSELQGVFTKFVAAKRSFTKFTGMLKNSTLRELAFEVSEEIEKISILIRSCQK